MTPPRLEIRNLVRTFGDRRVVDGVSLSIEAGQVTCLLGPSGCGKSTTLRMIAGVEMQDSGEIHVDGQLICDTVFRVPPERREIGLMFQDFALFPHLSVADNVAYGLTGGRADKRARVEEMLARVHMARVIDAFPHQLSGGEQQRTAIARALAPEPVAILLDEPFSGLDPAMRDQVREAALAAVREAGIPSLLVTHDANEALVHSDKIAIIDQGEILQTGVPETVYNQPVSAKAASALGPLHTLSRSDLPPDWQQMINGTDTYVHYRPEALQIAGGSGFRVVQQKLAGAVSEIELDFGGSQTLFAMCQIGSSLQPGTEIGVSINPALFFDFAPKSV